MMLYEPMDVLFSVREPYNKNTLWIYPKENIFEIKIYDKGWRVLFTSEDLGLSNKSEQQIEKLVTELKNTLNFKLNKEYGKCKLSLLNVINKNRELENKIKELENKIDRLTKRYGTLLVKTK